MAFHEPFGSAAGSPRTQVGGGRAEGPSDGPTVPADLREADAGPRRCGYREVRHGQIPGLPPAAAGGDVDRGKEIISVEEVPEPLENEGMDAILVRSVFVFPPHVHVDLSQRWSTHAGYTLPAERRRAPRKRLDR